MRHGENPREVTERIQAKIVQLQSGLPKGVRIVPFYDRTRLIDSAIESITETLLLEGLVASIVIFLIMWHFRAALIICLMLPMAVLISFILMHQLGISSNIMSLAGIAISIGVLVDAAIVMVDQAAFRLHGKFGNEKVRGNTREFLLPALRTVGRPIFFSLAIMIISFIPVFALGGMEGKMFHPLAYTKTFALVGVAVLAITLVPALIPALVRGRIRHEEDSWLVRRVIEVYRPVLNFLMDHPWPVVWTVSVICLLGAIPTGSPAVFSFGLLLALGLSFWAAWGETESFRRHWIWVSVLWIVFIAVPLAIAFATGWRPDWIPPVLAQPRWKLVGLGVISVAVASVPIVWLLARLRVAALVTMLASLIVVGLIGKQSMTPLGREFMPTLNEGSILDMPVTVPRASVTQAAADLIARDAIIRAFPEVELVVGKAGRAETPTDPAPLDMVETVVNLRPREYWPKRELRYETAAQQTRDAWNALQRTGFLPHDFEITKRDALINDATMVAIQRFDALMRETIVAEQNTFARHQATQLTNHLIRETIDRFVSNGSLPEPPPDAFIQEVVRELPRKTGDILFASPDVNAVQAIAITVRDELARRNLINDPDEAFTEPATALTQIWGTLKGWFGAHSASFNQQLLDRLLQARDGAWKDFVAKLNWRLFDQAAPMYTRLALEEIWNEAQKADIAGQSPTPEQILTLQQELESEFTGRLLLWQRDFESLGKELDSVVRVPGWGNIWTQPIINRINMLATGVNTTLGVRVFGDNTETIAAKCHEIAGVLQRLRGAADVAADQVVGEGYLEIDIDRQRAARFGISVGDIQDVVETALGGRVITMTVEGRERFPVRIRYARAFRNDEQAVKDLLITGSAQAAQMQISAMDAESGMVGTLPQPAQEQVAMQIPLSEVADVRVASGPSMIRSENGLLRSYVRLNVRDRDVIGFVEEAQKAVASEVEMPPGMYVEWTGQFEHEMRARRTLSIIVPIVVLSIFVLLYVVYHDLADALIVICLTVPGAIFGGVLFQYLFGYNFSVMVWVGFIACFGLATEGGLVILVYLRQAIAKRGGLENMTLPEVREAVMEGAVHRLRPKLMTELTTIIGLAPMLWASGVGSEMIQPMAAPVLGGILVADEVVDLLLPVLFYRVRKHRWHKIHAARLERTLQPA